jgi:atypical dual specificity phosphatase
MTLLFIDYRRNAEMLCTENCTLFGFINARLKERVISGDVSITKTVMGSAKIKLYNSVIVITEDPEEGCFLVSELVKLYPTTSFNYLGSKSVRTLFPEMKYVEAYEYPKPREFSSILPNLYISSMKAASDAKLLDTLKISAIINLVPAMCPNYLEKYTDFTYLTIYEEDRPDTDLCQYFDITFRFIERYSKTSGVLVHCAAGISRSSTIIIAYVMKKLGLSFTEGFDYVQRRHPNTDPNIGFIYQLQQYEKQIKEEKS